MSDPKNHYSTARGFVYSARFIVTNERKIEELIHDIPTILSYHMLLGFAVELYLKSFLQNHGHDENELRSNGIRHNLDALLKLAKADGFDCSATDYLVPYLNDQHANFEFRYVNPTAKYDIRWVDRTFAELTALDAYINQEIGAGGTTPTWDIPEQFKGWRLPVGWDKP